MNAKPENDILLPDSYRIGIILQNKRREQGLTQEQLAALVGVSSTHLSRIECGTCLPSVKMVIRLCSALSLGADELLGLPSAGNHVLMRIIQTVQSRPGHEQTMLLTFLSFYSDMMAHLEKEHGYRPYASFPAALSSFSASSAAAPASRSSSSFPSSGAMAAEEASAYGDIFRRDDRSPFDS